MLKGVRGLDVHHYLAFPEKMLTGEQTHANIVALFAAYLEKEPSIIYKIFKMPL
jgi:hypothetical protein